MMMMMTIYFQPFPLTLLLFLSIVSPISHPLSPSNGPVYFIRQHKRLLIYIKFLSDVGLHYSQRELFHTCEYACWSYMYRTCIDWNVWAGGREMHVCWNNVWPFRAISCSCWPPLFNFMITPFRYMYLCLCVWVVFLFVAVDDNLI